MPGICQAYPGCQPPHRWTYVACNGNRVQLEHGAMGTWEHGEMGAGCNGITWCNGNMVRGNMGTWEHGAMGTWCNMGTWEHGAMGTMVQWEHGAVGTWCNGNMVQRCNVGRTPRSCPTCSRPMRWRPWCTSRTATSHPGLAPHIFTLLTGCGTRLESGARGGSSNCCNVPPLYLHSICMILYARTAPQMLYHVCVIEFQVPVVATSGKPSTCPAYDWHPICLAYFAICLAYAEHMPENFHQILRRGRAAYFNVS